MNPKILPLTALALGVAVLSGTAGLYVSRGPAAVPSPAPRPAASAPATARTALPAALSAPAVPLCRAALVPGRVPALNPASPQCLGTDGNVQVLGGFSCAGGGELISVSGGTGAPAGWYLAGQPYRQGQTDTSAAYRAAYVRCEG